MELLNVKSLSAYHRRAFLEKNGYTNTRIPGIVCLKNGVLLCYYECRRGGDWSAIDIAMQYSTDGGSTWSSAKILVSGKGRNTMNNPVMIADEDTVWFFYCENYKRLFISKSENVGITFGEPTELTDTIDSLINGVFWSVLAVGPGHGIALADHSLVVPLWFGQNKTDIFSHHPSIIAVAKKAGDNDQWNLSKPLGKETLKDPSECCIAQKSDGTLILNIRNENEARLRAVSESSDGGSIWSEPLFDPLLPDPVCCAGLCACGNDLLFANCESTNARENLTVKRICPDGVIKEKLLISESGGYSDICFDKKRNRAFVVFENGTGDINVAEIAL